MTKRIILYQELEVPVHYRGNATIKNLIRRISRGTNPPDFVDTRLTDTHFPQHGRNSTIAITLVYANWWISHKEDTSSILLKEGYVSVNAAELLSLRAAFPHHRYDKIAVTKDPWDDGRGYNFVPCLGSGSGNGLRLRMINAGWAPFWKFAVVKAA